MDWLIRLNLLAVFKKFVTTKRVVCHLILTVNRENFTTYFLKDSIPWMCVTNFQFVKVWLALDLANKLTLGFSNNIYGQTLCQQKLTCLSLWAEFSQLLKVELAVPSLRPVFNFYYFSSNQLALKSVCFDRQ